MAAVDALKLFGVQSLFQRRNRLVEQIAAAVGMQPHIISLGLNPFNVHGGDANKLRAMRHPKFMRIAVIRFCRWGGQLRLGCGCGRGAGNRTAKTFA